MNYGFCFAVFISVFYYVRSIECVQSQKKHIEYTDFQLLKLIACMTLTDVNIWGSLRPEEHEKTPETQGGCS